MELSDATEKIPLVTPPGIDPGTFRLRHRRPFFPSILSVIHILIVGKNGVIAPHNLKLGIKWRSAVRLTPLILHPVKIAPVGAP
jgi:hypothetical protein